MSAIDLTDLNDDELTDLVYAAQVSTALSIIATQLDEMVNQLDVRDLASSLEVWDVGGVDTMRDRFDAGMAWLRSSVERLEAALVVAG